MNEILKFKRGRRIPKALGGQRFVEAGRTTWGDKIWADTTTGDLYKGNQDPNDPKSRYNSDYLRPGSRGHLGKSTTVKGFKTGLAHPVIINGADYVRKSATPKDYSFMKGGTRLRTADEEAKLKDPKIQAYQQRIQKKALVRAAVTSDRNAGKTTGISRVTPRGQQYWDDEFAKFTGGLSQEQQDWLKTNGLNNATKLQEYLNNMGFSVGKFGVDGKFANDSKTAWNNFVASGTMGKNNDLEILAKQLAEQPVIDAPDPFGYKTSNTYESNDFASKMKGMGIGSNADLINFMHNSGKADWKGDAWQTQFRSDVDRALDGDYSDANIKKVFGTQGKWGNGFMGRGDFGDFQNALQTNAGTWNSTYDKKLSDAGMDLARQQYAAKMAQQYTTQLTKPTAPKFMTNNFGINTLGDIDGLKGDPIYGKWVG